MTKYKECVIIKNNVAIAQRQSKRLIIVRSGCRNSLAIPFIKESMSDSSIQNTELSQQDGDRIIYFDSKEEMDEYLTCKSNMVELYERARDYQNHNETSTIKNCRSK